ncbi:MAG: hypothetical protein AB7T06_45850 [Kofleriaceae bacterium]
MRTGTVLACALALACWACGDNGSGTTDAAPADDMMTIDDGGPVDANLMPMSLQETGLCDDGPCATINPGILAYAPQYQLYSDGATKRRWIYLPPGSKIDTADMNYWKFPVGTKLWKEFTTMGGTRIETRFIMKVEEDDSLQSAWYWASFIWDPSNTSSSFFSASTGNPDAQGTTHDVPSRSQCRRCHQNTPGRVLGFQAMSLDYAAPQGEVDLQDLVDMDLLTNPPASPTAAGDPFFPIAGTDADKAAYGFMHANCGGCHNPTSSIHDTVVIEMRMDVTKLAAHDMPAYTTLVNQTAQLSTVPGTLVIPGDPTNSVVVRRLSSLIAGEKMPELGTETLNTDGIAAVSAWINQPP